MIVKVTQDDIDNGIAKDCAQCPIALCLKRVSMIECEVNTMYAYAVGWGVDPIWTRELPIIAQQFVSDFDFGFPVRPFEFELDIPEKYLCDQVA